jgi:hypothetical protein
VVADMGDGLPQSLSCLLQAPGEQAAGTGSAQRVEEGNGEDQEDATPARSAPARHESAGKFSRKACAPNE